VTPVDISFIDSRVDPTFSSFLQQLRDSSGSNLYLSFYPSIVTSFQVSYVYNNHEATSQKVTKFFRPLFEFGGVVPNFIAKTFGSEAEKDSNRLFGKQYFEYIRLGLDVRLYVPVRRKNTFVVRFNMGYAQPFGSSSRSNLYALPYEKYFFSGGNSSVRAWRPRRLGPGSYSSNAEDSYRYEQPGEILFETNYEYRFDIVSIFDGAFFVDAGNVWTIKNEKQGSQFQFPKVFNEIAVGAGFGLRLDFSFLVLRLDIANKVWDPAKPLEERFVGKFSLRNSVLNIGIGYPF
jgi:outer membrane protein insertion porin family